MSRWKIFQHLCSDCLTYEEKISHTLTHPIPQRIHNWPLKKERTMCNFFSDCFLCQTYYWAVNISLQKKYAHIVYDFWTMFSQMKISPIHCRQQTDGFESHFHTLGNLPLSLCYHGGDLRVTALKDQYSCKAFTENSKVDTWHNKIL